GACLRAEPQLVADCIAVMRAACNVPVPVKWRIGLDDQDSAAGLERYVPTVADAVCEAYIVSAQKAWLQGLSPKENRDAPPLNSERVYRLKAAHPGLTIIINGGIRSLDEAEEHLAKVDGVMLGRAAYQTPYLLAEVDRRFFGSHEQPVTRREAIERLIPYIERHLARGGKLNNVTRHILGLYHGEPGGRLFRRQLSGLHERADVEPLL